MSAFAQGMSLEGTRHLVSTKLALPQVEDEGALLEIEGCGICGSDWLEYTGRASVGDLGPRILGHEVIGRVAAIGGRSASLWGIGPGARIAVEEAIPCYACKLCLSGRHRMCPRRRRYGQVPLTKAPGLWGGYAEYMWVDPASVIHVVAENLPVSKATLFIPLSNGLGWLRDAGRVAPGDTVVVFGPGQHGLACAWAAKHLGAGRVIVVGTDRDQHRLAVASKLGADEVVAASDETVIGQLRDILGADGADVIVDVAPIATQPVLAAIEIANRSARIVLAGAKRGRGTDNFPTDKVYQKELCIAGVSARPTWAVAEALRLLAAHADEFTSMGAETAPLSGLEAALLRLGGEAGRDAPVHITVVPDGR